MPGQDQRRSPRLVPPRPLRARLRVGGQEVEVEVASVSPGGFGAWAEDRFAFLFEPGQELEALAFDDPQLPPPPERATLAYTTLPGDSIREGHILFGAEFRDGDTAFLQSMAELMQKPEGL